MNLKKEIILISIIFGTIIIGVLFFTFYYILPSVREASNNLTQTELSLLLTNNKQSERIRETYQGMTQEYQKISSLFTNSTTPLDLISFWEKTTGEENLIMKISPIALEKYKYDPWKFLGFEITLSGDFINIQKFIEKIENSKHLLEINNIVIKKNTLGQDAKKIDEAIANIRLKTYINQNEVQN